VKKMAEDDGVPKTSREQHIFKDREGLDDEDHWVPYISRRRSNAARKKSLIVSPSFCSHQSSSASTLHAPALCSRGGHAAELEHKYSHRFNELEEFHFDYMIESELEGNRILSPFLPTKAGDIDAFFQFSGLIHSDVLLDIGCGDGRVLISAAKTIGCQCIGVDITKECIELAKSIAKIEGVESQVQFLCVDATTNDFQNALEENLGEITVLYLYVYPTLLKRLEGVVSYFLARNVRVITQTYHLDCCSFSQSKVDESSKLVLYSNKNH